MSETKKKSIWQNGTVIDTMRWAIYSVIMLAMLIPFFSGWQLVTGGMILGWFSSQLNSLKDPR